MSVLRFSYAESFGERTLAAEGRLVFDERSPVHALMGPSGVGKTSFARWVVGLSPGAGGALSWGEEVWSGPRARPLSPSARRAGYLAQADALFPHLNAGANIGYGLRAWPAARREARVAELLELVGLKSAAERRPRQLSGGEKRRVALAQALAPEPRLLVLDEPFGGLDRETKLTLLRETSRWLGAYARAVLVITHDPEEAAALGAEVHQYREGRLEIATPREAR